MRRQRVLALLVAMLFAVETVVFGASAEALKKKRKEVEEKIRQNNAANEKDKANIRAAESQVGALDGAIRAHEDKIDRLSTQMGDLQGTIDQSAAEIQAIEQQLHDKEQRFIERLRAMYMQGDTMYLSILLRSASIQDYLSNQSLVQVLAKQDRDLMAYISEQRILAEDKKAEQTAAKMNLELLKVEVEQARAQAEIARAEKERYIQSTLHDVQLRTKANEQFNAESKKLEALIAAAQQPAAVSYKGGKIGWPVPGAYRISSPFGNRADPFNGRPQFHSGIDIPAPSGRPVVAAEGGVVTYATWMGSYGQLVVISHGNNLSTAYAHNSKILVQKGQKVSKGQTIALIGTTGYSTGPHSHFEVRVGGKPTNPVNWVGRK